MKTFSNPHNKKSCRIQGVFEVLDVSKAETLLLMTDEVNVVLNQFGVKPSLFEL